MIIDFHTHCFSDALYERAISVLAEKCKLPPTFNGSLAGLKGSMAAAGISYSVVCNISTNVKQTEKVNDWAISCVNEAGIIPFGSVHPDYADYKSEINRLHAAGVKGLKFHPDYQCYEADSPAALKIYEYAAGLGMVMIFHTGEDLGIKDEGRGTPARMLKVITALKYPKIVAAHMGGEGYRQESYGLLAGKEIYFDTSFGFSHMPLKTAKRFLEKHGAERIMFGSDAPWGSQKDDVEYTKAMGISKPDLDKIFYQNAAKLLGVSIK